MKSHRMKNPELQRLASELDAKGIKEKKAIYRALAKGLNRPRGFHDINVLEIERLAKANQTVVVPGKVLGVGELTKPVNVAALNFSSQARAKIEKSGGKAFAISELMAGVPKGTKILG